MSKISKKRVGFSLVELLVVLSIIVLLIAVLLPSLQKARENARAIKCESNLRQMMIGWFTFIHENKSQIPYTNTKTFSQHPHWVDALDRVIVAPALITNTVESFNACPSVQTTYPKLTYLTPGGRWGYAVNTWWSNVGPTYNDHQSWDMIRHPWSYPWFSDPFIYPFGGSGFSASFMLPDVTKGAPNWGVGANHSSASMANVAFADGVVKAVPISEIQAGLPALNQFDWLENK